MISILFQRLNKLFPFIQLLKLLLAMSITVQFIIITYNHFSGFNPLHGIVHFIASLLIGSALSLIAGILIAIPDLFIIAFLNRRFPWSPASIFYRVFFQLSVTVLLALAVSILITLLSNWISVYKEGLTGAIITNALIFSVVNTIMMIILEGWLFFKESNRAKRKADALQNELLQVRFEVLKSQINPHFLFNSLNVLSGLIEKDVSKAQLFIDEFAKVYRYVLETIEKPVVSLGDELDFVKSYIFLQQIRYGEHLQLTISLPSDFLGMLMPPISLQVVLENAMKHNIVNQSQPLQIDIYADKNNLMVRNNIQPKLSAYASTGLGQNNLIKRYALIGESIPRFKVESNYYIVTLPLIHGDYDKSTNH